MIEYLTGNTSGASADSLNAALDRVTTASGFSPFSDPAMDFVTALSRKVLADRSFRDYPELMAMAHWFRRVNLRDMRTRVLSGENDRSVFTRRGVVFHIAPSNVDSVFIYSWLISLLCGNSNIARVSRHRSAQMQAFFIKTSELFLQEQFFPLGQGNLVLSYDHDAAITESISSRCHLRVVWGGDQTVNEIRSVPLPPLATELAFANRFSFAVLNASAVSALDPASLETLTQSFYNDTFWFNQQACSSPRTVVWIGTRQATTDARKRFWPAMVKRIERNKPENQPAQVMNRITALFRLAHNHQNARGESLAGALPSRILVDTLGAEDRSCHDGNGLFVELIRTELSAVIPLLTSRDQTIAYFGFDRQDWLPLLRDLPPHAADRIVPVGEALTFGAVWDGVDLLRAFTREIQLHGSKREGSAKSSNLAR